MKFIYIETKKAIEEYVSIIFDLLNNYINLNKYDLNENTLIIYHNENNDDISSVLTLLSQDLLEDILIYDSLFYTNKKQLEIAVNLFKKIKSKNYLKYKYYNNKKLLEENIQDENLKKLTLSRYYNDISMYETIITFLEYDQNITQSSKVLFLHRNSLDIRLNKFRDITNFDLKKFKDAVLIYNLLK